MSSFPNLQTSLIRAIIRISFASKFGGLSQQDRRSMLEHLRSLQQNIASLRSLQPAEKAQAISIANTAKATIQTVLSIVGSLEMFASEPSPLSAEIALIDQAIAELA